MNNLLATVALGFLATSAHAQYRCVEDGRTLLTDRPCASEHEQDNQLPTGKPNNVFGDVTNSAYSTTSGGWRGQAQYQATVAGAVSPEAHAVVQMIIEVDPQGKVTGSSPENGCKLKGIASPGGCQQLQILTLHSLDVLSRASIVACLEGWLSLLPRSMPSSASLRSRLV